MVIVLMSARVNAMVAAAQWRHDGIRCGYFFGADLITDAAVRDGNNGEILLFDRAGPLGALSCAHFVSDVTQLVPVTFVHEFQHMISFNQHYLVRGSFPEDTVAERRALALRRGERRADVFCGRLPRTPRHLYYVFGDVYNAGQYFAAPQKYFLCRHGGDRRPRESRSLRLFVRYLVDQVGATLGSTDSVTRRLDLTALTGAANASTLPGPRRSRTLLERWALANYVSDLSGFTAPPELQYITWQFPHAFPKLRTRMRQHPRFPPCSRLGHGRACVRGSAFAGSGMLRAGSEAITGCSKPPPRRSSPCCFRIVPRGVTHDVDSTAHGDPHSIMKGVTTGYATRCR